MKKTFDFSTFDFSNDFWVKYYKNNNNNNNNKINKNSIALLQKYVWTECNVFGHLITCYLQLNENVL